jgi:hypothetical protein
MHRPRNSRGFLVKAGHHIGIGERANDHGVSPLASLRSRHEARKDPDCLSEVAAPDKCDGLVEARAVFSSL